MDRDLGALQHYSTLPVTAFTAGREFHGSVEGASLMLT